ncbi:MAG: TerB family tellurite resistance protein [Nannocystis sp.]|uniref:tellurite resistance TerB family protein n=1 Tax=Nannocystis sp. TaxID=1962667 RepID=UPI0024208F8D|nr:TerB family tellurite resistance protein [Nannocystis sp.]MBK9754050.1 TerB family tellurite resistance protein [Nannocystis sp.]
MILFGAKAVTSTHATGQFYCPGCDRDGVQYEHRRSRRFVTFYYLPLIPLNVLGEYIECQVCKNTYKVEVLAADSAEHRAVEAEFQLVIKRVMILMLLADGVVADAEIEVIRRIYQRLSSVDLPAELLREEVLAAQRDGDDVLAYLERLAPMLNARGKELVIKSAFLVATADEQFQDKERQLLADIGMTLGLTTAQVHTILGPMNRT